MRKTLDELGAGVTCIAGTFHGYGLWIANPVCDLVQLRSLTSGVAVRPHVRAS